MPDVEPAQHDLTFDELVRGYLEDYELHGYRAIKSARSRIAQLRRRFGDQTARRITAGGIRDYQLDRRRAWAATGTINRETSALSRMFRLAIRASLSAGNAWAAYFGRKLAALRFVDVLRSGRTVVAGAKEEGMRTDAAEYVECEQSPRRRQRWGSVLAVLTIVAIMALNSHVWAQDAPQPSPPPGAAQASLEDPEWFQGAVQKAGPGVTMPVVVKSAKPTYTRQAMDARVQGEVLLDARVDAKGRVTHVRVVRSLAMLDAQAEAAAKQFEFRPARKDGDPVPAIVRMALVFHIK
jgi:TonB family protein